MTELPSTDQRKSLLTSTRSYSEARQTLLTSIWIPDRKVWYTANNSTLVEHQKIDTLVWRGLVPLPGNSRNSTNTAAPFSFHEVHRLPDVHAPPDRSSETAAERFTDVHRFRLSSSLSKRIRTTVVVEERERRERAEHGDDPRPSRVVTNVGGYHGPTENLLGKETEEEDTHLLTSLKSWTSLPDARDPGTTFFVYGSLRPDDVTGMPWRDHWLEGASCQQGVIRGTMYDDMYASVVVPSSLEMEMEKEKEVECDVPIVVGWLVEYSEAMYLSKLKESDSIEGYPRLYGREKVVVRCMDGTCCIAWCYVRTNCSKEVHVVNGDWVTYQKKKQEEEEKGREEEKERKEGEGKEEEGKGKGKGKEEGERRREKGGAVGGGAQWCPLLENVVQNAVKSIQLYDREREKQWKIGENMKMTGWLNVSTASDFNAVHDHGTADWSFVYYFDITSCK